MKRVDLDLRSGFLSVETAKTGERIDIPIFRMLAEELYRAMAKDGDSAFCFPAAARGAEATRMGSLRRSSRVHDGALEFRAPTTGAALPPPTSWPEDIRARVEGYVTCPRGSHRVPRMLHVFDAYVSRASFDQVIASPGCSRVTVSNYLNQLERENGASIVRGPRRAVSTDGLQKEREKSERRASLYDFYSFRPT